MVYRQLFLDAIADALCGTNYRLVNCPDFNFSSFYIYQREIGITANISFNTYYNTSGFDIIVCLGSLSEDTIEDDDLRYLNVSCYTLNEYASVCGLMPIDNNNPLSEPLGRPKRYTKALLVEKLQQNMELFRKSLLADFLHIENMEDYFNFRAKMESNEVAGFFERANFEDIYNYNLTADAIISAVKIPYPSEQAFSLCLSLGKFKEASYVYLLPFFKSDYFHSDCLDRIDTCMKLELKKEVAKALEGIDMPVNSSKDAFIRFEREAKVVENILRKHQTALMEVIQNRVNKNRIIVDRFFAKK